MRSSASYTLLPFRLSRLYSRSMDLLPLQIRRVIEEFTKLPGIGPKSAERITFHLLRSRKASPENLGSALLSLKEHLSFCARCQMITTRNLCAVCEDSSRDGSMILVVEEPLDVVAFEKSGYRGTYHVLHGVLSPIDGMGPEQLKLRELIDRCTAGGITEVVVATNLDIEGEATATFIRRELAASVSRVSRLAHGLPRGADIEFADHVTLREAIAGRRAL